MQQALHFIENITQLLEMVLSGTRGYDVSGPISLLVLT